MLHGAWCCLARPRCSAESCDPSLPTPLFLRYDRGGGYGRGYDDRGGGYGRGYDDRGGRDRYDDRRVRSSPPGSTPDFVSLAVRECVCP